jgi:proliferating cell nuclear antigen PCNA
LNTRDKQQQIQLVFNPEESDKLFINFTNDDKKIFDKSFELPLMDIETDVMDIPNTDSQAEFSLPSGNFANIINQLKIFGDNLDVECTEDKITLNSTSQECGKMKVEIDTEDLTSYSITEGETVKLSFSLTILHNICMYSKISKEVEIHFVENYPMKIKFDLGENNAQLTFYLAPKISDD